MRDSLRAEGITVVLIEHDVKRAMGFVGPQAGNARARSMRF